MGRNSAIGVVVLGILIALSPLLRGQEEPADGPGVQWEYRVVEMSDVIEGVEDDNELQAIERHFNGLGEQGWQFVQVNLRAAIFKRPRQ